MQIAEDTLHLATKYYYFFPHISLTGGVATDFLISVPVSTNKSTEAFQWDRLLVSTAS
jgi:hypothetical protein